MYENGIFMFSSEDLNLLYKRKKFRIYGNILGSTHDIISFLLALEKNYNSILAHEKIVIEEGYNLKMPRDIFRYITQQQMQEINLKLKNIQEISKISDIISVNEYLEINKINFNSPGFWEVIGNCNPLRQIRKYIEERHQRQKDKKYAWDLDKKRQEIEIEEKQLHNDMMRLTIIKDMSLQLKCLSFPDNEIMNIIQDCYKSISLLDKHIENERIIRIEELDDEF